MEEGFIWKIKLIWFTNLDVAPENDGALFELLFPLPLLNDTALPFKIELFGEATVMLMLVDGTAPGFGLGLEQGLNGSSSSGA